MKKIFACFTFTLLYISSFGQGTWYKADGTSISPDTVKKYRYLGKVVKSLGNEELGMEIVTVTDRKTKKAYDAIIWYIPLVHIPIAIKGEKVGDYSAIMKQFNANDYHKSASGFGFDFNQLKSKNYNTQLVVKNIQAPDSIETNTDYYKGETYHYFNKGFSLIFEDGKLIDFKK